MVLITNEISGKIMEKHLGQHSLIAYSTHLKLPGFCDYLRVRVHKLNIFTMYNVD